MSEPHGGRDSGSCRSCVRGFQPRQNCHDQHENACPTSRFRDVRQRGLYAQALYQGAAFSRAETASKGTGLQPPRDAFQSALSIDATCSRDPTAKKPPKLKTPETEASGVSILITRSTADAASSGYPSGRPPAFAGAATSGCAGFQNSDLRRRPALQLDRWPTFRLGSVSCPSARPAANLRLASTVPHFRSTGGDPSDLRRTILPPARPTTYLRFASVPSFGSAGGFIRLAPHAAPAPRLAPPPVCTGYFTLRLHRP